MRRRRHEAKPLYEKVNVEETRGNDNRPIRVGHVVRCPAHASEGLGVEVPSSPPGRVIEL